MRKLILILFSFICLHSNAQTVSTDKNAVVHSQFRVSTTNTADGSNPDKALISIQYSDGLGRPLQTVGYQQSPTKKDIVSGAVEFDMFGRAVRNAMPAPTNASSGAYIPDAFAKANAFYVDNRSFSEISAFDNSPLNRVREQFGVGIDWKNANKSVQSFDEIAGSDVRLYRMDASGNVNWIGFYPANSLYKKRTVDEQGHTVLEFTSREGLLVQKQVQDDTGFITTYYVYDGFRRIGAIIQPEGYALNINFTKNSADWQKYIFGYDYDSRGRMHIKQVPGGGEEYMVYDRFNRLVLTQTAQQREILPGESYSLWTFYKYDHLNREIMRGTFNDNATLAQVEAYINTNVTTRGYESRNSTTPLYYTTGNSYPNWVGETNIRQITYYDDYATWLPSGMAFDATNAYNASSYWPNAKGDVIGSRSKKTENSSWLASVIYKDNKGRVLQTQAQNAFGQIERTDIDYNFAGEPLQTRTIHKNASNAIIATELQQNQYDHTGLLLNIKHGINATPTEIVRLSYDEIRRLTTKKILPNGTYYTGGVKDYIVRPNIDGTVGQNNIQDIAKRAITLQPTTDLKAIVLNSYTAQINPNAATGTAISGLQTINYTYHIRGGLLGINLDASKSPIPSTTEGDLFSYKLDYQTAGYWDGNIGKQTWATQNATTNALETRNYLYNYDASSRLKYATYTGIGSENFSIPNMSYDKNGNITNLQRNGRLGTSNSFGQIDNLTYGYTGNRLNQVTDAVGGSNTVDFVQRGGANYTYWNDGSLKSDANEQISLILYDSFLKQPKEIQLTDGRWIKHYYNGAGTLLKTTYSNGEYWDFVGNMIYKNGQPYQMNTPEGRATYNAGVWTYEFDYKDHLGNTRVSFKANGSNLEKTAETAFDPWGVRMNIGLLNAFQNRIEMQGKEKESTFGLNRINLGARMINPTTGR